jgi:hypothetical protein
MLVDGAWPGGVDDGEATHDEMAFGSDDDGRGGGKGLRMKNNTDVKKQGENRPCTRSVEKHVPGVHV